MTRNEAAHYSHLTALALVYGVPAPVLEQLGKDVPETTRVVLALEMRAACGCPGCWAAMVGAGRAHLLAWPQVGVA